MAVEGVGAGRCERGCDESEDRGDEACGRELAPVGAGDRGEPAGTLRLRHVGGELVPFGDAPPKLPERQPELAELEA